MRIICDQDEVLGDFMPTVIDLYNIKHQTNLKIEDITEWKLPPGMKDIFQYTKGLFVNLKPIDGAISGIKTLSEWGHDVIIATAPSHNGEIAKEKLTWIEQWLPEYKNDIVLTQRKEIFDADLIIDDHADHIDKFKGIRFLVDRPWNRSYNVHDKKNTVRILKPEWDNILKYVPFADFALIAKR